MKIEILKNISKPEASTGKASTSRSTGISKGLLISVLVMGILYSIISIVNHYFFRTYALDLGAYTNALFDYSHFRWNDSTVFKEVGENLLADHFDLYLMIFSPLSLLFGTYTLLIVQIVFVLLGGIGVYQYFNLSPKTEKVSIYASLYFFLFFGVWAAIAFDYHSNVVAAALVPWFFYFLKKKMFWATSALFFLLLISKENISLWVAFICLGLMIEYRKDNFVRNYLLLASLVSFLYFFFIINIAMPYFSNNNLYPHFQYNCLGESFSEAILYLIHNPIESIKILFINHTAQPYGDYVKLELHVLLLFSGLPLLLRKPQYLLMLVPVYFQKLFHNNPQMWGFGGQYSIEFAPILAIGAFMVISTIKNEKGIKIASISLLVLASASSIRTMDNTVSYTDKDKIRFYQASHYTKGYDVDKVHGLLSGLPREAIVSALSPFVPHLALRDKAYQFPIIKDAEYIVYSTKESTYPLQKEDFNLMTKNLESSPEWTVKYKDDDFVILKRSGFVPNK